MPAGPHREKEKDEWGVSDPASALCGPLRAGSLTPTCLVSVVLQVAARMCAQIVPGFVTATRDLVPVRAGQSRDNHPRAHVVP